MMIDDDDVWIHKVRTLVLLQLPKLSSSYNLNGFVFMPFFLADIEPPMVTGCPSDTTIPVTMQSSQVTHSWNPPVFTDNSGTPFVSFGCSSTGYYYCHMFSSGNFSVGKTEVMFNATDGAGNKAECSFIVTVTGL